MPTKALALVTAAALLHASWNAMTKRASNQLLFLWSSMGIAALALLPVAAWIGLRQAFEAPARSYVLASALVHAFYFVALSKAYRHGEFSLVYPMARGLGVAMVPAIAWVLFQERLSPLGIVGIGLVVLGIAWNGARGGAGAKAVTATGSSPAGAGRGIAWACITGLCIAAYSTVDAAGARAQHPLPYLCLMSLGAVGTLAPWVYRQRAALRAEWQKNKRTILIASTMNLSGYLLVLFAYRISKTGYVVACRELSIAIAPLLGAALLGETRLGARVAGAAIILGGVACVALAR